MKNLFLRKFDHFAIELEPEYKIFGLFSQSPIYQIYLDRFPSNTSHTLIARVSLDDD